MLDVRFHPITLWPREETKSRLASPFHSTYNKTLDLLEFELAQIKARDIVIQCDFRMEDLRNDGWPKSDRSPRTPRVIVSFDSKKGALSFPCDRFRSWQDNIRAIALALEALRKMDRYGITVSNEQYRGWAALPPAPNWRDVLGLHQNGALTSEDDIKRAFNEKAQTAHPDRGGSASAFDILVKAREAAMREIGAIR